MAKGDLYIGEYGLGRAVATQKELKTHGWRVLAHRSSEIFNELREERLARGGALLGQLQEVAMAPAEQVKDKLHELSA